MKFLIAVIVAMHVLAHSVLGCCSHQAAAHAPCGTADRSPASSCERSGQPHASAECHVTLVQGPAATVIQACDEHSQHACLHARCQWLGRITPILEGVDKPCQGVVTDVAIPSVIQVWGATRHAIGEPASARLLALPLRLHLVIRVLLI